MPDLRGMKIVGRVVTRSVSSEVVLKQAHNAAVPTLK